MKKILFAIALFAAVSFVSCNNKDTAAATDTDSVTVVTDSVSADSVVTDSAAPVVAPAE